MKCSIILAFLLALPLFGQASLDSQDDLKREIAKIAAIQNSVERLAAYDDLAAKLGVAPSSRVKKEEPGRWSIDVTTSPVDDSQTVAGALLADTSIDSGFGQKQPTLILRYKEGRITAYVDFDIFLGSDSIDATVRYGKGSAEMETWSISTDSKAAFYMGDAMGFMKRLSKVDTFLIRVTPYNESPVTVTFSPGGVERVIEAIQKAATGNGNRIAH